MARAKLKVPEGVELVLSLTPEEAETLRSVMQNPFYEDESETLSGIRHAIWNALSRAPIVSSDDPD